MPARVTLSELLVGTAVVVVAVVAEAALLLAHGRSWSLGANAVLAALLLVGVAVLVLRHRPAVAVERAQLAVVLGVGAVAAVLSFPGFPVGMAGWDPGVYTNHGLAIARTGAYDLPDPVLAHEAPLPDGRVPPSQARFPGTSASSLDDGRSTAGFYHLYPALLAPAADVAGERGVVNVNPVLGVLTAMALALVAWRAFGPVAGTVAGLLAATNMIQVWHARYPTSEVLTELLLVTALLGVVVARDTGWRIAAGVAGAATGAVFLARADGFLVVYLAVAGLALLAATRRFDQRAAWFAGGLALVMPHALLQAYVWAENYTIGQGVPDAPVVVGGLLVLGAAGLAGRRVRRLEDVVGWVRRRRRPMGIALVAGFSVVLLLGYLRPLWVTDLPDASELGGSVTYYNARAMERLTWFFTPVGIAALWIGLAVVALRQWSFSRWVVVVPSLAVLPVYLLDARIAPRLIWWTRRFVPFAMAGLLVLMAVGVAALVRDRRSPVRVVGALAAVVLVGTFTWQSWALRGHDELAGSFLVHHATVDLVGGEPAVWLWASGPTPPGYNPSAPAFASTMLYRRGDPVTTVDPADVDEAIVAYRDAFPDLPIFLLADGAELTGDLAGIDADKVGQIEVDLPLWELTYDSRPDDAVTTPWAFSVFRVPDR